MSSECGWNNILYQGKHHCYSCYNSEKKNFFEPHVYHNAYNFVELCTMPMTSVRIWPTIRMTPFYYPIQCTWAKFWIYTIEDFTEHYMYSNLWKRCRTGITSFNLSLSYNFLGLITILYMILSGNLHLLSVFVLDREQRQDRPCFHALARPRSRKFVAPGVWGEISVPEMGKT